MDSIEDAQRLSGQVAYVQDSELTELDEDEYYFFDLIGLEAYTDGGAYLGKVEDIMERAIQSILVIKNEESEVLIPITEHIVKEVNLEEGKIIITPIHGILDQD